MSFVMLTESQVAPPTSTHADGEGDDGQVSDQLERTTRLFEIISARSDIDHPVCVECADMLVEGMQKRLVTVTKERDAYVSFLRDLGTSLPTDEETEAARQSLKETVEAEEASFEELVTLEKEKAALDEEIAGLEEESRQLDKEEEEFWRDRNAFALTLGEFQNERDAMNMRYEHDARQLERLQRTNVYNDAFCIGHDGYFGTINGLRLGRMANSSVEWPEINAAWGQTTLLLATIAEKLRFQFRGYRLKPLGSSSKIEKFEYSQQQPSRAESSPGTGTGNGGNPRNQASKVSELELFSSGDLPLNLPWMHRKFDAGMVAFLECLRQLGEYMSTLPVSSQQWPGGAVNFQLPYEIKKDKIHDASIKIGFNQNDETWTRACKYTLTCCKFLLAHASNASNVSVAGGSGRGDVARRT